MTSRFSDDAMPAMSIVLAADSWDTIRPVIDCLEGQALGSRIEIVVVLPSNQSKPETAEERRANVLIIEVESVFPLSAARAAGVRAANAPLVFLGETHSFPRTGMFDALIEAHTSGWTVVVLPSRTRTPTAPQAGRASIRATPHGPQADPPESSTTPRSSTHRSGDLFFSSLARISAALSTGEDMISLLRASGHRIGVEPAARIGHAKYFLQQDLVSPAPCRWTRHRRDMQRPMVARATDCICARVSANTARAARAQSRRRVADASSPAGTAPDFTNSPRRQFPAGGRGVHGIRLGTLGALAREVRRLRDPSAEKRQAPSAPAWGLGRQHEQQVTESRFTRHRSMRISLKLLAPAFLAVSACASPPASVDKPRSQMTQREKDSVLAVSKFVGSGVVKKAVSVSDAQDKRNAMYDSAGQ